MEYDGIGEKEAKGCSNCYIPLHAWFVMRTESVRWFLSMFQPDQNVVQDNENYHHDMIDGRPGRFSEGFNRLCLAWIVYGHMAAGEKLAL